MRRVIFDTSVLVVAINPKANVPPASKVVRLAGTPEERMKLLIQRLEKEKATAFVPAPVLAELLVRTEMPPTVIIDMLSRSRCLQAAPFDQRAAIECAILMREAIRSRLDRSKAKVKFDCQIVATARVLGVSMVYTDDGGVRGMCTAAGIATQGVWDLPAPERDPQFDLLKGLQIPDPVQGES